MHDNPESNQQPVSNVLTTTLVPSWTCSKTPLDTPEFWSYTILGCFSFCAIKDDSFFHIQLKILSLNWKKMLMKPQILPREWNKNATYLNSKSNQTSIVSPVTQSTFSLNWFSTLSNIPVHFEIWQRCWFKSKISWYCLFLAQNKYLIFMLQLNWYGANPSYILSGSHFMLAVLCCIHVVRNIAQLDQKISVRDKHLFVSHLPSI